MTRAEYQLLSTVDAVGLQPPPGQPLVKIGVAPRRRGASRARRDDREYRESVSEEQSAYAKAPARPRRSPVTCEPAKAGAEPLPVKCTRLSPGRLARLLV